MKKTKVIAICNQKGGVGKTATAVSMSIALAHEGKKVLLVDFDSQGDTTYSLGWYDSKEYKDTIASLMKKVVRGDALTEREAIRTHKEGIDVITSNDELSDLDMILVTAMNRERNLKTYLDSVKNDYDYVILDCPPSLGLITLNALAASDSVLVPIQCEYYALEGLSQLMATIRQVKRLYNPSIELEGVLLTMFDGRLNLTIQVVEEVKKYFPNKVYRTTIPRNVRLSEAPSFGMPCVYFDRSSKGARAYMELAEEFLQEQ